MSPAAQVAARADAKWTDAHELAFATDAQSYPDRVLLAIRRRTYSCVIAIPASEYDGLAIAQLLGFEQAKPDPLAKAIEAVKELSTKKKEPAHV